MILVKFGVLLQLILLSSVRSNVIPTHHETDAICDLSQPDPEKLILSASLPEEKKWKIDAAYINFNAHHLPEIISSKTHEIVGIDFLGGKIPSDDRHLAPSAPVDLALYFEKASAPSFVPSKSLELLFDHFPAHEGRKPINAYVAASNDKEEQLFEVTFDNDDLLRIHPTDKKKPLTTTTEHSTFSEENTIVESHFEDDADAANKEVEAIDEEIDRFKEVADNIQIPRCLISTDGERFYAGEWKEDHCIFKVDSDDAYIVHVVEDDEEADNWAQIEEDGDIYYVMLDEDEDEEEDDDDDELEAEIKMKNLFGNRSERKKKRYAKKLKRKMRKVERKQKKLLRKQKKLDKKEAKIDKKAAKKGVEQELYKKPQRTVLRQFTATPQPHQEKSKYSSRSAPPPPPPSLTTPNRE
ncbi:uncharacterized protein MONOS_14316 [Monocercomonoides exilis]|uniref:uncharacterized protein n=1 Tax=Monocercomonoides exilis TaxID=2049356 RepID=UPI0035597805|nr:hypothetical protein MONOS_14316 [Monocercomonoides exilis]|eukprot:MONOS_14316.1-p1 / transcript=MONOS_14316.1 / gene=MONOS_14316 / organism=Monocercomonoides_exilis_PA203 / gene_product=unspecified product / transcript_product=unspecified product / location=Mono_scaffold00979:6542-7957(+) / protein_length=411 / sequence_SO=supercontig / SO=protein_coding / is_pseudo=false